MTEDVAQEKSELQRMLSEKEVLKIVGVGRSTLWRMIKSDAFPPGVYVAPNVKRWLESDIIRWQRALAECDCHNPARGRGKGRRRKTVQP